MDTYIREIKAEPKATGVAEILIPGEIEHRTVLKRKEEGIELPIKVAEELAEIGRKFGLDINLAAYSHRNNQEA
jgi:LDH2 family malate/lactate/ureidoglycolate dehydrogenase